MRGIKGVFCVLLSSTTLASGAWKPPFSTLSRWIVDSNGNNVTYAGANWPGAAEVMIPEGMQYASIESTVSKLKSLGMNVVRLTFAIELVDDILDNGGDVTVSKSLINALGSANGTTIFQGIQKANPQINENTTRLEVYDMVAEECAKQGIFVHLDNHISKAMWCCSTDDGNGWFGDTYFDVDKWKRGLSYMVSHAASWSSFVSIGLRNELRQPTTVNASYPYNWETWYAQMIGAASVVNSANSDALIFLGGIDYDTTLSPIPTGNDLGDGREFHLSDFNFSNKLVLEIHNYDSSTTSCDSLSESLLTDGFDALETSNSSIVNVMPVVMTEFGFLQDDTTWQGVYASCLRTWLPLVKAGWITWVLAGSYYIREGIQDADETWGLLNHAWTDWRSQDAVENGMAVMVNSSLA
ncbi:glycoside hydrolase superfamily [Talaromyces proteolyticus]|uniref:Glycoside hydrolase superfamily n=1 Tax=Talaromyces proteolyticus TaxID=1131652 RepID=A0AAD4L1L1_9EURO|nr:glycoside hydrolase superfamily [Talaromyces proteolyticus]KAH8705464.1 glycoside hydrolase superfamily [Talaromyces proteolyticus]